MVSLLKTKGRTTMKKALKRICVCLVLATPLLCLLLAPRSGGARREFGTREPIVLSGTGEGTDITEEVSEAPYRALQSRDTELWVHEGGVVSVTDTVTGRSFSNAFLNGAIDKLNLNADAAASPYTLNYRYQGEQNLAVCTKSEAVDRNQYRICVTEDKVITEYVLGESGEGMLLPYGIPVERYEALLSALGASDAAYLERRYTRIGPDEATPEMLTVCPGLKERELYYLTDGEAMTKRQKTAEVLQSAGYSQADYEEDRAVTGEKAKEYTETYRLVVEYSLQDGDLIVNIPCNELQFHPDNPLLSIDWNAGFGYAETEDEGYYVLLSGSGALQRLGGNQEQLHVYSFYGKDYVSAASEMTGASCTFPIFGMIKNESGFLAIIEEGAEVATLTEKRANGASTVYPSFRILEYEDVSITANKVSSVFSSKAYQGNVRVRYHFLKGEQANYSAMARYYRDYLLGKGALSEPSEEDRPPVLLELIGNIQKDTQVMGMIPMTQNVVLTDFAGCRAICEDLEQSGVSGYSLKLSGFNQRGLFIQTPGTYDWSRALGDSSQREAFLETVKTQGHEVYLDVNLAYYYGDKAFDGYRARVCNARTASNGIGRLILRDKATGDPIHNADPIQIVSPSRYEEFAAGYAGCTDLAGLGLSLGDSASCLNSDYNTESYSNRADSAAYLKAALESLTQTHKLMTQSAAEYLLPTVSLIENQRVYDAQSYQCLAEIPFVQMALSGRQSYTTVAVNSVGDHRKILLEAIESNSILKYTLAKELPQDILSTEYNYLFYIDYGEWKDTILSDIAYVSEALQGLERVPITAHEIRGNVRRITYENQTVLYVNYGEAEAVADGVRVPGLEYVRVSG